MHVTVLWCYGTASQHMKFLTGAELSFRARIKLRAVSAAVHTRAAGVHHVLRYAWCSRTERHSFYPGCELLAAT